MKFTGQFKWPHGDSQAFISPGVRALDYPAKTVHELVQEAVILFDFSSGAFVVMAW